jgi:hypothetical protein
MGEIKVYTAKDIQESARQHRIRMSKIVYIKGDYICIRSKTEHRIELSRCDTYSKILWWCHHLCDSKGWMTTDIIRRFIELAVENNHLKMYDGGF